MDLTDLENCFAVAYAKDAKYIAVIIEMRGFEKPEIIINRYENFKTKLDYYKKAYREDLILKSYDGIKIINFLYGNSLKEIEEKL